MYASKSIGTRGVKKWRHRQAGHVNCPQSTITHPFEIAYVTSVQLALESGELYGSGSSRIIGTCTTESMRILVSF